MSLYSLQKLLYDLNRDPRVKQRFNGDLEGLLGDYELDAEELEALRARDIGKLYVLGVNGQLLMHLSSQIGQPWAEYIAAMREGVAKYGPVRAGIYAMTTAMDEKVAGV
jgi:hypothetical protein